MGRKGQDKLFRYVCKDKRPEMGFPKTLTSSHGLPSSGERPARTSRKPQKRPRRMGTIPMEAPSPSEASKAPREVRIKPSGFAFRLRSKPLSPSMRLACSQVDPIASPFTTPKPSAKKNCVSEHSTPNHSAKASDSAEDTDQKQLEGSPELEAIEKAGIHKADDELWPDSPDAHQQTITGKLQQTAKLISYNRKAANFESPSQSQGFPFRYNCENVSASDHSGGLLSNHISLSMETLKTPISAQIVRHAGSNSVRRALSHASEARDSDAAAGRTLENPRRALSFEGGELLKLDGTQNCANEHVTHHFRRKGATTTPLECRKPLSGKIEDGSIGREKSHYASRHLNVDLVEQRVCSGDKMGNAKVSKQQLDTPTQSSKGHSVKEEIVQSSESSRKKYGTVSPKMGEVLLARAPGTAATQEGFSGIFRRARAPDLMRKLTDTEFTSDIVQGTSFRVSSDFNGDNIIYYSQFVGTASDEESLADRREANANIACAENECTPVERVNSGQDVERMEFLNSAPEKGEDSEASVTEPPTPEDVKSKETEIAQKKERFTVTCKAERVSILAAGALRSPETPESISRE